MPTLIRLADGRFSAAEDAFADVADEDAVPEGPVILSLTRFQADGDALVSAGRPVGVRIQADEAVEDLAYDLPRLALVALVFPKYRDGRAYSSAALLRQRLGYAGEVRAVGDVLREQAGFMVRCGIDAFAPADGSTPEDWAAAASRYRHVYQRAVDARAPAFEARD
ncbi:MAG TPA: DUF934 domain-containing protein [Rubrivivax sp.]|nr:DUF934 domain-containing protein [Rubrivivax sp.]